ncbi:AAA family ATPase [Thermodesulfobacteriota bacterium]
MLHIKKIKLLPEAYPTGNHYPFNIGLLQQTLNMSFRSPVSFFVGENGTGKSTLLTALSHRCGIHLWERIDKIRFEKNPFKDQLYRYLSVEWTNGMVPGSFFAGEMFRDFAKNLDEWAAADPEMLKYFGGKSLMAQSHGQSLMAFFKARYKIKGLYLLDEPETALSPRSQVELVKVLLEMSAAGHAQFIIATHSPIILACPGAQIFAFDHSPIEEITYEDSEHYRIYKSFMEKREKLFELGS